MGNEMSNISDQMAVAIVIFAGLGSMAFMAFLEDRKNRLWDEAWRAGYEQGMKVVRSNVR